MVANYNFRNYSTNHIGEDSEDETIKEQKYKDEFIKKCKY